MSINAIDGFLFRIKEIEQQYRKTKSIEELTNNLLNFASEYSGFFGIGDYLLNMGEEYISNGNYQVGIVMIQTVDQHFPLVANKTLLNLRMAEYHIDNNEKELGIQYLVKLCSAVSNYEESIANNELTEIWQKLHHYVDGMVPPSVRTQSTAPKAPKECTMLINDIFSLQDDDILEALSTHLGELSADGDCLNYLNKWERIVYFADELCVEVNSGGLGNYLYYRGLHFEKAYGALREISAFEAVAILDSVREKFPKNRIPKTEERLQNTLDTLEEQGIDFETEDDLFYSSVEKDLLKCLLMYVKENRNHLR